MGNSPYPTLGGFDRCNSIRMRAMGIARRVAELDGVRPLVEPNRNRRGKRQIRAPTAQVQRYGRTIVDIDDELILLNQMVQFDIVQLFDEVL